MTACGDSFYQAQNYFTGPVEGVGLKKSTTIVSLGSEQLYAIIAPSKTKNKNVIWTSSDSSVATVDNNGLVNAVAVVAHGVTAEATITVTTEEGGFSAQCKVTVVEKPVPVTSVTLSKSSSSLVADTINSIYGTEQIVCEIFPSDATDQNITWTSSAPDTASVDAAGLVTAKQPGSAVISVTSSNGIKAACIFNIAAAPVAVTALSLNKTGTIIKTGESERFFALLTPSNATNQTVTWQSSDTSIAEVDVTGSVKGIAEGGPVTITATSVDGAKTATATITVVSVAVPVTGVNINKGLTTINIGKQEKLTAAILPSNATNQTLSWKSSNGSAVSVDSSGTVTGLTVGTSTVTVATADGGFTKNCLINVISDPTYTVTYNSNEGTGSVPVDSNSYLSGTTVIVMSGGSLTRSGYTFAGWTAGSGGNGTVYASGTQYTVGSSNITFYAKWTSNPTYTVTYDDLWRTGGSVPTDGNSYQEGQYVTVKDNTGGLYKTGYAFMGWYIVSSTVYKPGEMILMGKSNIILSAKWGIAYPVTYNGNGSTGGSVPLESNSYAYGQNVTVLGNTNGLVRTNYNFAGWCTDAACMGTVYQAGDICNMPDNTLTLYAKWTEKPKFTVTYVESGSTSGVTPSAEQYYQDSTVPVKSSWLDTHGFLLKVAYGTAAYRCRWKNSVTGDLYDDGSGSFVITSNVTMSAQWVELAVGDRGPAGGWIFETKPAYSDGWRYKEVAPANVAGTGMSGGRGLWLEINNLCSSYISGGHTGWYLPTLADMQSLRNIAYDMYTVTYQGGFSYYEYWTSTNGAALDYAFWYGLTKNPVTQGQQDKSMGNFMGRPVRSF